MSIFSAIKDKIFGSAKAATPAPAATPEAAPAATAAPAAPQPVAEVDVVANLTAMGDGKNLNWQSSIVDLMKLLGLDSSLDNRKALAQELGYSGALDGSAEMNIWLHKATMRELAANGGKVPKEMQD